MPQMNDTNMDMNQLDQQGGGDVGYMKVEDLQQEGILQSDIQKLKAQGYGTSLQVVQTMRKDLVAIKGLQETKVDKIIEAQKKVSQQNNFLTSVEYQEKVMQHRMKITTGSSDLDKILGGGLESGQLTEFYGEYRTGKTQLQMTLQVLQQQDPEQGGGQGRVLYIDSDGTFRPERIYQIQKARGFQPEEIQDNILCQRCHTSEHLLSLLQEQSILMCDENCPFQLIIVDSIMGLFRHDYNGRGELSERQQALGRVLSKLQKLSEQFNVAVFLTNQVMADPSGMSLGVQQPKPIGGNVLQHAQTTRVYIRKGKQELRVCKLIQSPFMPDQEQTIEIYEGGVQNESG